jgi:hypothetical protein
MLSKGDYVGANNRLSKNTDLLFWGEWAPPSNVDELDAHPQKYLPHWLHRPYLPELIPSGSGVTSCSKAQANRKGGCEGGGYQNTDPYVFDGAFKYLLCKQGTQGGAKSTGLAELEAGSLILFGSTSGRGDNAFFQLDTVFVVADYIAYNPAKWAIDLRSTKVSAHYLAVVAQHAFRDGHPSAAYRLYSGATYDQPVAGMYSFTPARACDSTPSGFPRVKLRRKDLPKCKQVGPERALITNNLNAAPRCTEVRDQMAAAEVWQAVREACRKQKMGEGVRFDTPVACLPALSSSLKSTELFL